MTLNVYSTLTRRKEPFKTVVPGKVGIYLCGPTVYKPSHIGHAVGPIIFDAIKRYLTFRGYQVTWVVNITDVDDKLIVEAGRQKVGVYALAERVTADYLKAMKILYVEGIDIMPKASEHIGDIIRIIEALIKKGYAYTVGGDVYFDVTRDDDYGKLSNRKLEEQEGQRDLQSAEKRSPGDFALWKAAKPEDEACGAAWDSPWGRGRPGWHLECSAMAMALLGETLDLHCGGIDLVFPHHEDEIAQSEAATGKTFARCWCHGEFLLTDGAKMAKRVGNVQNVEGLKEAGIGGAAVRHLVFSTHYRKQLNLSGDALEGSLEAVRRVGDFATRLAEAKGGTRGLEDAADRLETAVRSALFDDLNAPEAMAALFEFIRAANKELDQGGSDAAALRRAREVFTMVNGVLDLIPEATETDADLAQWVEAQLVARKEARARRDFGTADAIRQALDDKGIVIEDTAQGTRWKRK